MCVCMCVSECVCVVCVRVMCVGGWVGCLRIICV